MLQSKQSSDKSLLTQQLRRFSVDHVKITKEDTDWAKRLVDQYIKNEVLQYISSHSILPISKQEYTGSLYEKLKTEAADEVDVMVVLQTTKQEVTQEDAGVPGFILLKAANGSPLEKYTNGDGYILPEKLRASWFFGLVQKAVNELKAKSPDIPVELKILSHGPAVQLDIIEKSSGKKLSADLVPSFQFGATDYFVAKTYKGKQSPACDPKLFWRQSFSLKEKARLQGMDKEDHGCRHELLRIVKTIIRGEVTFAKLTSYHLKTVFLRYNGTARDWSPDVLGERFIEYLEVLYTALADKRIDHFWVPGVNLLDDIQDKTLENMADRLRRILDSDKERNKVLKCLQVSGPPAVTTGTADTCSVSQPSKKPTPPCSPESPSELLPLLRGFVAKLGNALREENKWSKEVINRYLKDGVLKYCQERSVLISKCEYGGSLYESLKTKGPDEGDVVILLVLKTRKDDITPEVKGADHALLKSLEGSVYREQFSNPEGFVIPEKVKVWLYKLVVAAVQGMSGSAGSDVSLKASNCRAGVKVKISEKGSKALEVQLVPTFQLDSDQNYVPPSQCGTLPKSFDPKMAWTKSYTLLEKSLLKDMDQDKGCRHDIYRVVKTVLQREPTFSLLTSGHLKMALLWYNQVTEDWSKDSLAERFTGFLRFLQDALKKKVINHFWTQHLNLVSDIPATTLENMHSRVAKILSSEQERSKVLRGEEL